MKIGYDAGCPDIVACCFSFFCVSCSQPSDYSVSPDVTASALAYLKSLPDGQPIRIWPTFWKPYEVLDSGNLISDSVERYSATQGGAGNSLFKAFGVPQISLIAVDGAEWQLDAEASLAESRLLVSYKKSVLDLGIGSNGCSAYKFISRDTWMSVGVVLVDREKFGPKDAPEGDGSKDFIDICLHGALDFLDGFPTAGSQFDYSTLPAPEVRSAIIRAIYQCALSGGDRNEMSRDGIMPLPKINCVESMFAM